MGSARRGWSGTAVRSASIIKRELLDALNNGKVVHVEANVAWDTNNAPVMEATFMAELTRWPTLWPTETIAILRVPIGLPAQESREDENNER